ncbi:DgyrCDS6894 [Dimorphilus gyrociliatus]|uniref:DgyrCDS6894 n=1 Tax=Dimorphilus gyrociliatus TaxID=2664684 RepID=A0A7I8VR08_9ANNE|nr:DgyrCDS6894 [Dimorphilus gyrociliatus]
MEELLKSKIEKLEEKLGSVEIQYFKSDCVTITEELKTGGESTVFSGQIRTNCGLVLPCAIKQYNCNNDESLKYIMSETEILVSLYHNHPTFSNFFIRFFGLTVLNDKYCLLMEKGISDLLSFKKKYGMKRELVYEVTSKLLRILHFLHSNDIVHHDLKPENILIKHIQKKDRNEISDLDICLIDFSMTKKLPSKLKRIWTEDCNGTQGYQAPELIKIGTTYDQLIDIFACGVTICVLLTDTSTQDVKELLQQIHNDVLKDLIGKNILSKFKLKVNQKISKLLISMLGEKEKRKKVQLLEASGVFKKAADEIVQLSYNPPTPPTSDEDVFVQRPKRKRLNNQQPASRLLRSGRVC